MNFQSEQTSKAWIGLYKKGTSNEWSNVLAWSWVTSSKTKISNISHFHEGDYQARLFFNNSYISEGVFPREDAKSSIIQFPKLEGIFEGDDYKVIIFEKDTYNIIKTMTPISI